MIYAGDIEMKNGLIIDEEGNQFWYKNDKLHRDGGPAVLSILGDKFWYQDNELHRLDGPAVEIEGGHKAFYFQGKQVHVFSQEEFDKAIKDFS